MTDASESRLDTRLLMTASAIFMAVLGVGAAFFSEEILRYFGQPAEGFGIVLIKVVAGLYLGLAMMNWMARGNLIGGIYSRPVAAANVMHFVVVTIVLLGRLLSTPNVAEYGVMAGLNGIFAAAFAYVTFGRGGSEGAACG